MPSLIAALKTGWSSAGQNNAGLLAAGIAYYAFLSFMPLLAAMVLSYGLFVDPSVVAEHAARLAQSLPASAGELVSEQIQSVAETRDGAQGFGLAAAIALSLFGARLAAGAVITALNVAFGASESRGFIRANLLALGISIGGLIAIGIVAGATALVATLFEGAGARFGSFALVGLIGGALAAIAYRVVPNVTHAGWQAVLRGACVFALGWTAASAGFGFYAANFTDYNATYGSLGAIAVFLTWLFLSAYALLLGGHVAQASRIAAAA